MKTRKPEPITCRSCGFTDTCSPCHFGKEVDYKTRTGICKKCAKQSQPSLLERANAHSLLGTGKLSTIANSLAKVQDLPGATAELGVYKGGSALLIAATASDAPCHLFDTFEGIPCKGENDVHNVGDFRDTALDSVKALLQDCPNAKFHVGLFPATAQGLENETFKFVHIDGDQYQTTRDALEFFYPRMAEGGVMLFDDYKWQYCPGVEKALVEFFADKPEQVSSPHEFQAVVVKGESRVLDVHSSGRGVGDTISALFAATGLAVAGHRVRYHAKNFDWLSRVLPVEGLEIVPESGVVGVDMNADYGGQLRSGRSRKQWYCDNLARELKIESFGPAVPSVDNAPRAKPIDAAKYVLLSPFSAYGTREWPKAHWQRLAVMLSEAGYEPIALGGTGDAQGRRLRDYFGSTPARWFWGMSAEWVMDAMLQSEAVIGNDSGMVHIASLLGVKAVAVHAHISPAALWEKQESVIPVFSQEPCAGCGWQGNKGWRQSCDSVGCSALMGITPARVVEAVTGQAPDTRYTPERDLRVLLAAIDFCGSGNIVEIGCNAGETTAALAQRYPHKTVYGFDFTDAESLADGQRGEVLERAGIGAKATQPNARIAIQDSKTIDYSTLDDVGTVFIDGDHSYEGVKADTELALAHLEARGSGLILWHDAYEDAPEWCGVWRYLQELKAQGYEVLFAVDSWVAYLRLG